MFQNTSLKMTEILLKCLISFVALSGIGVEIYISRSLYDTLNLFAYFTIQSNLIAAAVMLYGVYLKLSGKKEPEFYSMVKNAAVLWILVTGTVYHFMLSGRIHAHGIQIYALVGMHYIVPALTLLNWFLFEEKGKIHYQDAFVWLIYPLIYLGFTEIRLRVDGFSPYWFLNPLKASPDGIGSYALLITVCTALIVIFSLLGLFLIFIDHRLKKKTEILLK